MLRFGIPPDFVQLVKVTYEQKRFAAKDAGPTSAWRAQSFAVSQGARYHRLFIVDARKRLDGELVASTTHEDTVWDLRYADDTLILSVDATVATKYMEHIATCGSRYGLSCNWAKPECVPMRAHTETPKADG